MNEQELREMVNPVFNTAKSCVQLDAASGDEDSRLLLEQLGFGAFGDDTENKAIPAGMVEQIKKLFPAYTILVESRFQAMNRLVESMADRTVVDLPCGYTSRGIRMFRRERTYFGFDLPAVIDDIRPATEAIIGNNTLVSYHGADATNYDSLETAFDDNARNFLITTEGLLMYFAQPELEEVFSNIRRLLQKHGGSWVITDRAYFLYDKEVAAAALNHDPQLTAMYEAITNRAAATTADVTFNGNVFFDPDEQKVRTFITKMGFLLNEINMSDYLPEQIGSLKGNPDADAAVREVFKKMTFWELTVADNTAAEPIAANNLPFEVKSSVKDGTLEVSIQGRMDTITAPELLQQFQNAGTDIKAIHVDVSRMPYVSSAGLRVFLMMCKSLENKDHFKLSGMSKEVREIFETTGFDQLLL
ncbi:MAG: STAS domain-containing protein [Lachnospiraceae bacterium]|nr:STAS domain-containing protein [Lachnospiraceae bacterium]